MADESECRAALLKLKETFATGKTKNKAWRISQLRAVHAMITENEASFADALAKDLGRTLFEAIGLELLPTAMEIRTVIGSLDAWMKPTRTAVPALMAPAVSEYVYEPFGVCLIISAFNYPIQLTLGPLLGAIMAGNCAVIKPSELSGACEKVLQDLIPKYLDNDSFSVICGGIETTSALLKQPWDKIFFTGSTRVGKIVMHAAAENLTPVSLELGGKSPTIIDETVTDMELVTQRILWGKCANAGQTCIAPDYILCHTNVYDQFIACAKKTLLRFYGEDAQKSPDYGRIVNKGHCERLKAYLDDTPGTIAFGGRVDVDDRYVQPTLITDVRMDSKLMKDELFGPLLPVIRVASMDEALTTLKAPGMEKPLTMYIFSKNRKTIDRIISEIPSGGVLVNDTLFHFANSFVPFGGVGPSGLGGYHGKFSFECFSHRRTIMRRDDHMIFDVPVRYPPYTAFGLRIFRLAATVLPPLPAALSVTNVTIAVASVLLGAGITLHLHNQTK